jgi:hypothetical protein
MANTEGSISTFLVWTPLTHILRRIRLGSLIRLDLNGGVGSIGLISLIIGETSLGIIMQERDSRELHFGQEAPLARKWLSLKLEELTRKSTKTPLKHRQAESGCLGIGSSTALISPVRICRASLVAFVGLRVPTITRVRRSSSILMTLCLSRWMPHLQCAQFAPHPLGCYDMMTRTTGRRTSCSLSKRAGSSKCRFLEQFEYPVVFGPIPYEAPGCQGVEGP